MLSRLLSLPSRLLTTPIGLLQNQTRHIGSKSARNKTAKWIGSHKEPLTEAQRQRRLRKRHPFVLGRDNVKQDYTPIRIPDAYLQKEGKVYSILRTQNGRLPVYSEFKNGRGRVLTIVRRIEGDVRQLAKDLSGFMPTGSVEVKERTGHVVVQGNHQRTLRYWFSALGF